MRGFLVCALATVTACAPAYDPVRIGVDEGTLGRRIVTLMCKRLAFQADPTDVRGDRYRETCRNGGAVPEGAPATIVALTAHRERIIKAIDAIVPEDVYDPLQAYLTSGAILGLYDDDTMAQAVASLGELLTEIGADDAAMAAFARQGVRAGYRPVPQAIGPAGPLTGSPHLRAVLDHVLPTLLQGGRAHAEWNALLAALSATLRDAAAPADALSPTRVAAIASTFLLSEHPDLGEATPLTMVRRDRRGIAQVALVDDQVPAPFVDLDGDLLADVDGGGRFVDASGAPLAAPSPFPTAWDVATRDDRERAVDDAGRPIYVYFDADRTLIGAMGHDQRALLDPDKGTALDFLRGAALLLGERAAKTRVFDSGATLPYRGWDTDAGSPLLDLAHAFAQLLRDPAAHDVLALVEELVTNHQAATARLLEAAVAAARLGDAHPEAQILADAPLWDDLVPLLRQIASNPALMRDVMLALRRPEVRQLASRFQELMTHNDRFDIASDQTVTGAFSTMPDRAQPDSGFNRSLFQRLLHVINDTNGAVECSKAGAQLRDPSTGLPLHTFQNACDFYRINNMAVFYLQTMVYAKDAAGNYLCETPAGAFGNTQTATTPEGCAALGRRPRPKASFNYNWPVLVRPLIAAQGGDAYLEQTSTITGLRTHPTTQALNRALLLVPRPQLLNDLSEPSRDKFGELIGTKHAGTLPVWEKNNFFDQIRPVVQAFADHSAEQVFVDLLAVLHKHWSSAQSTSTQHTNPAGPNYTLGSNAKSFEPLVIAVMQSDLWPALTETATELNAITVNGKAFAAILAASGRFLTTPLPGLADRRGTTTTTTSDGRPVTTLTPFHLLADAQVRKRAHLGAHPELAAAWTDSVPELVDLWFRGEQASGTWRFKNPRVVATTRGLTALLRGRLDEHDGAGDRAAWLSTDLPRKLEDFFTHPLVAAAADLIEVQTANPEGRRALELLLRDAFEPGTPAFDTMRVGAADLVQLAFDDADLVPLAHLAGRLVAGDRTYLATQLSFLSKLHAADTDAVMTNLVARLFRPFDDAADPGIPAISAIVDGVGEVDRVEPSASTPPWSAADFRSVFSGIGGFLREEQRGLPRFITIVKGRDL